MTLALNTTMLNEEACLLTLTDTRGAIGADKTVEVVDRAGSLADAPLRSVL